MTAKRGRPLKIITNLSQQRLVTISAAILEGLTPKEAVEAHGGSANVNAVLLDPGFPAAMLKAVASKASGDMLPKALRVLSELLADNDSRVKLAAANSILRLCVGSGSVADLNPTAHVSDNSLESLSTTELAELITRLEDTKAARAVDVSNETNPLMQFG